MQQPIGIFDSGIGGLTVASAIRDRLPGESLLYFGDTAHMPYGDKSEDAIRYYSLRITQFLRKRGAKAIVIACNSASSVAAKVVQEFFTESELPVIDVIQPVVLHLEEFHRGEKIGVIGTKATIGSKVFEMEIGLRDPEADVRCLATPLLAPMIEEGFYNNTISQTVLNSYLSRPKLAKIDSLVLACTHYPLIKPEIQAYYKDKVQIIDTAKLVAEYLAKVLEEKQLLAEDKKPRHHFYVSDFTPSFAQSAQRFFGKKVRLEEANLW